MALNEMVQTLQIGGGAMYLPISIYQDSKRRHQKLRLGMHHLVGGQRVEQVQFMIHMSYLVTTSQWVGKQHAFAVQVISTVDMCWRKFEKSSLAADDP